MDIYKFCQNIHKKLNFIELLLFSFIVMTVSYIPAIFCVIYSVCPLVIFYFYSKNHIIHQTIDLKHYVYI